MTTFDEDNAAFDDDANPPEESNNRTFLVIAGILGGLVLLGLLCVAGYVIINMGSARQNDATLAVQGTQQAVTIQAGLTQRSFLQAETLTAAVTFAVEPTNTPVIAQATLTPTETANPATATIGAAFTQIAVSTQTIIPTSTALPNTGFADDVGAPGLMMIAIALVAVIFLVRRLRASPSQ
ncbi:MAG: LPXTG cell wall anchor domain-containing protein [Anaerolineales bacterium]|nr:LPXTG cell wall anchor domain-containing protein [Anaerolineales bacterium]